MALVYQPDYSEGHVKPLTTEANFQSESLDLLRLPDPTVTPVMPNDRGIFFFDPDLLTRGGIPHWVTSPRGLIN